MCAISKNSIDITIVYSLHLFINNFERIFTFMRRSFTAVDRKIRSIGLFNYYVFSSDKKYEVCHQIKIFLWKLFR